MRRQCSSRSLRSLIAATYPLAKRFIPIPQLYLGVAFSFGIPMAFAAVLGTVPAVGWLLMLANAFWVIAYDTEYAMVDRDDDLRIGIRSSAIFFGRVRRGRRDGVIRCIPVVACCSLAACIGAGWPFYAGCAVAASFASLSLRVDSHAVARWMHAGVSAQQLGRCRDICRHGPRLRASIALEQR